MKVIRVPDYGRNDLAVKFKDLGFTRGVEIGTEKGKFAEVLLRSNPSLKLYCIDPYKYYDDNEGYKIGTTQDNHEDNYREAMDRLKGFKYEIIKTTSEKASWGFADNSIDFVYIDGNHRLDHVVIDLTLWTRKVKPGGIISGHDYIKTKSQSFTHIPYALEAYFQSYRLEQPLFILDKKSDYKSDDLNKKMDRIRSWYFIKE